MCIYNIALEHKFGTVGCVARDKYGNLAAAGSTGGLTNKHPGRIGVHEKKLKKKF